MYAVIGTEILESKLSIPLHEVKAQSYFYNGKLVEKLNIIYLKFDTWIRVFFDDGVLFIREKFNDEPKELKVEEDLFEYPIIDKTEISIEIDKIINKEFFSFTISEAFELFLEFENRTYLRIAQKKINQSVFGPTLFEIIE